jgi:hypothetical protein
VEWNTRVWELDRGGGAMKKKDDEEITIVTTAAVAREVRGLGLPSPRDILGAETVSDEEAEKADFVVCGDESHFHDDVRTLCTCGSIIYHRPHAPRAPKKICMVCADAMMRKHKSGNKVN